MRLNLWPRIKIRYPSEEKGQLYIPSVNWLLGLGCIGIVLGLRESSNMEAAYGLAITLTMIMTTLLLTIYLYRVAGVSRLLAIFHALFFFTLEGAFLAANLSKIAHGGWITLMIGGVLFSIMWLWRRAGQIKNRYTVFTELEKYYPLFKSLVKDKTIAKYATHLVYLSKAKYPAQIEEKIIHSIFRKHPKRADTYWLIHVATVDEPYTQEYSVHTLIPGVLFRIDFRLGFRVDPKISLLFRRVLDDLVKAKEVDIRSRYPSLRKHDLRGDFNFVILERVFSTDHGFSAFDQFVMNVYILLRWLALSERKAFGLDTSLVTEEKVPGSNITPRVVGLERVVTTH
jgi:KUP system potassium uptake protein